MTRQRDSARRPGAGAPDRPGGAPPRAGDREQRLAAALRANLRRRKQQARARDAAGDKA